MVEIYICNTNRNKMKYLIIILSIIFSVNFAFAQDKDIVTEEYVVSGNCGECKERIERAAYVKGVKLAEWDKDTKKLKVVYKPSKTSAETILHSVADAGYDSEKYTADEGDYKRLPKCCQYRTGTCSN